MLTIVPLPEWAVLWRPEWVALVVIYWSMALPRRVGVGYAWILGLLLDIIKGTLLGQHALGFAVIAYLTLRFHQRIRVFPLWQQSFAIGLMLAIHLLLLLWVYGMMGRAPQTSLYWGPVLTSMALWPWVFLLLRDVRRRWCLGVN